MKAKAKPPVAKATETIEMGTGNVFADLGLPDADERHLRVLRDIVQVVVALTVDADRGDLHAAVRIGRAQHRGESGGRGRDGGLT